MWLLPNNKTNSLLLFPIGPRSAHWRHYQVLTFPDMRCPDVWSHCPHLPTTSSLLWPEHSSPFFVPHAVVFKLVAIVDSLFWG